MIQSVFDGRANVLVRMICHASPLKLITSAHSELYQYVCCLRIVVARRSVFSMVALRPIARARIPEPGAGGLGVVLADVLFVGSEIGLCIP